MSWQAEKQHTEMVAEEGWTSPLTWLSDMVKRFARVGE